MDKYSLTHLSREAVLGGVKAHLGRERESLALVLAHIGEIEAQDYYKPAGYSSVHMYCVHELHLSKDAAYKRIHAARAARRFPAIFARVAEGALCLTVVNLLVPHLEAESAGTLLAEVAFRTRFEVEQVLATRNPRPARTTTIQPVVQPLTLASSSATDEVLELAPGRVQGVATTARIEPIAAQLYDFRFTGDQEMYDELRTAKDLLGHRKPVPDEVEILKMALGLLVTKLRSRKHGATDRPRAPRTSKSSRHVSHEVMRLVWERDGGQCTFVGDTGKRCPESSRLEYDHKQPVARGGDSRVENIRLRCRAHNQLEAERAFGKSFMQHKREQARSAAAKRRAEREAERAAREAEKTAKASEKEAARAAEDALDRDEAMPWLRGLGFSIADARSAVAKCGPTPELKLESRIKRCLSMMPIRGRRYSPDGVALT